MAFTRNTTVFLLVLSGCAKSVPVKEGSLADAQHTRLEVIGGERTGLTFRNTVIEDDSANYFRYMYMYNGGGVSAGDLDGDGLPDLAFVSNRNGGALYRNLGGLRFEDVAKASGFDLRGVWATGITMVDVNADGLMDIYVCASGPADRSEDTRRNRLFINQGNFTFKENASLHGHDDTGHSTQATFADLDGDNDLDCFIVGHRVDFHLLRQAIIDPRFVPVPDQSDKLYINDGHGHFTDRSKEAGVMSRNFGLATAIGDIDEDGRNDIYVANDFYSADQLLRNEGNDPRTGLPRFKDVALEALKHTSYFSMGVELADYNNDGLNDIYVLDMTPSDHRLNKENMASMAPVQFGNMVKNGFHHQYMVNTLHLNNGNGTWSELGQMAGVDRTDWSWAPLFVDLDNDGWKDLFVTNGITRDVTNSDFRTAVKRIAAEQGNNLPFKPLLELAPTHVPEKMVFRNKGDLTFEKAMDQWNFHQKTLSNGAVYADLDGDGDMDIVTANVNAEPSVVRNMSRETGTGHYMQLVLQGDGANPNAIGAKVMLYAGGHEQRNDLMLTRGFQSSVEPILHFGLAGEQVDSVVITWPDGRQTLMNAPAIDRRHHVDRSVLRERPLYVQDHPMFTEVSTSIGLRSYHNENPFDDFAVETLLPQRQSAHGPAAAVADVNGDGTEDLFITSSAGSPCNLFLQKPGGGFVRASGQPWERFKGSEFIGAHFLDVDGDHDMDLYLAAGSTEFPVGDERYRDRLFLNNGQGQFTYADEALPDLRTSTQVVSSQDIDADGDLDLFVGGRNVPGAWPAPPRSHVLLNEGGRFTDASSTWLADRSAPGLVTDAVFADIDNDQRAELLLCGEWMPLQVLKNTGSRFTEVSPSFLDTALIGWWQSLNVADVDADGDLDLIAGNLGLNNKFHPSAEHPLKVYMDDFDGNGTNDIVLAKSGMESELPVRGRECSSGQMPFIKDKFPTYKAFAAATLEDIFGHEALANAVKYRATTFASTLFVNEGGQFIARPLPMSAQIAPLRSAIVRDMNDDGHPDLLLAGNLYGAEVETSRYDAGMGMLLVGDKDGSFAAVSPLRSGISIPHDLRQVLPINLVGRGECYVVVNNEGPVHVLARTGSRTASVAALH